MRGPERIAARVLAAMLLAALPMSWAAAERDAAPADELEAIQEEIEAREAREAELRRDTAALERELKGLRAALVETGQRTVELERQIMRLEAEMAELHATEAAKREALAESREDLAQALGAAERLALFPPEAALAMPGGPDDAVRSAIVLRSIVPRLRGRMQAVAAEMDAIAELRAGIAQQRAAIETASAELGAEQAKTAKLLERKARLFSQTDAERQTVSEQVSSLAAEAKNLRSLIVQLEEERRRAEEAERRRVEAEQRRRAEEEERRRAAQEEEQGDDGRQQAALPSAESNGVPRFEALARPAGLREIKSAMGEVTVPVAGPLVQQFGERTRFFGTNDHGLVFETRAGAQVVAPFDGRVAFAGPFRGYGRILIIDHGEGYHSLLIGLDRIDTTVNQWLLAGEPVGTVGRHEGGTSALYLELREQGRPIDPLPWLAFNQSEASG